MEQYQSNTIVIAIFKKKRKTKSPKKEQFVMFIKQLLNF